MTYVPGPEVSSLASLREVVSWAIGAHAPVSGPGSLAEVGEHVKKSRYEWHDQRRARWIDYGDCPGHEHAYWFLRMGLMEVADVATVRERNASHSKGCSCCCHLSGDRAGRTDRHCDVPGGCGQRWVNAFAEGAKARDFFDQESLYRLDALCRGAGIPDDVQQWIARIAADPEAKRRGRRDVASSQLPFDQERVRGAIAATREARASGRPRIARPDVPSARGSDRASGTPKRGETLTAADGSFVVDGAGAHLRVARVNRVTGAVSIWSDPVELITLGAGTVLAVAPAGPRDLAFVWAADDGTWHCIAHHPGGPASRLGWFSTERASSAVQLGTRALLVVGTADGRRSCPAFPGLDIASLVAASSGGRTVVLAVGNDRTGTAAAFVEINGRARFRVADADVVLQRPSGGHAPPAVIARDGHNVALTLEHEGAVPFGHWVSHACSDPARSA